MALVLLLLAAMYLLCKCVCVYVLRSIMFVPLTVCMYVALCLLVCLVWKFGSAKQTDRRTDGHSNSCSEHCVLLSGCAHVHAYMLCNIDLYVCWCCSAAGRVGIN